MRHRGATMIEYALAVTVLATALVAVVNSLESGARGEINNQADCVSTRPPPPSCVRRAVTTTTAPPGPPTTPPAPPTPSPVTATWGTATTTGSGATFWSFDLPITLVTGGTTPLPDTLVRARVVLVNPGGVGTSLPFFVTCRTSAAGTCTLHFDVPIPLTPGASVSIDQITPPDPVFQLNTPPPAVAINAPP